MHSKLTATVISVAAIVAGTLSMLFKWWASIIEDPAHPRNIIDTQVYQAGGAAAASGGGLYETYFPTNEASLPFTYPPAAALSFIPMSWLPFRVAAGLTAVAGLVVIAVLLWWILRRALPDASPLVQAAIVIGGTGLACWSSPIHSTFAFGQVNILLMGLVCLDLLRRPGRSTGVGVGVAASLKLTPAVFVLHPAAFGRWRSVATTVGTAVVVTLLSAVVLPRDSWHYWTDVMWSTDRIGDRAHSWNKSLMGTLLRLLPDAPSPLVSILWLALVAAVLVATWLVLRRLAAAVRAAQAAGDQATADLLGAAMVGTTALVALLCSPVSWWHHWTWAVLFIAVLAAISLREARRGGRWLLPAALAATGLVVFHDSTPMAPVWGESYQLWAVAWLVTWWVLARRYLAPSG